MKPFLLLWGWLFPYKTKADRKKLYKLVLERMLKTPSGFCYALDEVERYDEGEWWQFYMWKLPELYLYKPFFADSSTLWWRTDEAGMAKRFKILNKIST